LVQTASTDIYIEEPINSTGYMTEKSRQAKIFFEVFNCMLEIHNGLEGTGHGACTGANHININPDVVYRRGKEILNQRERINQNTLAMASKPIR
jgi:hypothetical protein